MGCETWPRVNLGEICKLQIGRTPPRAEPKYWGLGHPWLSIADMNQGRDLLTTKETITDAAVNECNCRPVPAGTVVISFKLSVGKVGITRRPMFTNEAIAALHLRQPAFMDAAYMYHALKALDFSGVGERAAKGITLNLQSLARLKVSVPPVTEQRRIAAVLDKADGVRHRRRESLHLVDEFLRAAFLEMFGDPVKNEKGWEVVRLGDCFAARPRIGTITPATSSGDFRLIRVGELGEHNVRIDRCARVSLPSKDVERFDAREGDLLLARAIGSEQHLGKASVLQSVSEPVVFDSHVMRLRCAPTRLHPSFLWQWLRTAGGRRLFLKHGGRTAVQFNINAAQVSDVRLPLPPIREQERFLALASRSRVTQSRLSGALGELDRLFDSLAQRAFRGGL